MLVCYAAMHLPHVEATAKANLRSNKQGADVTMPLEEQVLSSDSPPFQIRHFVSTIRGKDFSKCWPFSQRILEKCLLLGMKVELPPLDCPSNGYILGNLNNTPQILFSECSREAVSCGFSIGDYEQSHLKEPTEISRRLADSEEMVLHGVDAVDRAENNTFLSDKSHLLFTQNPGDEAVLKPSTNSYWDDNSTSLSIVDTSISGSQTMVQGKAESADHVGLNLTGKSGVLHVVRDNMVVFEEPNYGLFQVAKEEGCNAYTKQSIGRQNTVLSCEVDMDKLHPSAHHDKVPGDTESPTAVYKPVPQLAEFEPNGYIRKTEKSKYAVDLGLLRSNSDASMPQVCPICLKFSSGSNTALNAHIDQCLALDEADIRPAKKRFKIKKTRSMMDIYATAPTRTLEDLERSSRTWSLHKI